MHAILLPFLIGLTAANPEPADVAVVCPAEFRAGMQTWVARREKQGHVVQFVSNLSTPVEIRQQIRDIAKGGKLRFVLLVGDAPTASSNSAERAIRTPTFRIPSKMNRAWGGDPDFATDNPYADLDDDRVPDLAIGRLSAHSADELNVMLAKILAYEQNADFGRWRTKINFVAGDAGFGAMANSAMETIVHHLIFSELPPAYETTLTYASWQSPFCPDPRSFHQYCTERMNEGCLFWVFMGHGSPRTLQWAVFPDGGTPILRCEDCAGLHCQKTPPIVLCMCCYTGAFAEQQDCLAEDLLRSAGGPVAVFSGSNVTMPYGMTMMGRQAIGEYFQQHCDTLGEWLLKAKRDTVGGYNLPIWALVNSATSTLTPQLFVPKEERLEHLQLFNLLGDPTMQLRHPSEMELTIPKFATAGQTVAIQGKCSLSGKVAAELVRPLGKIQTVSRQEYDGSTVGRKQFEAAYRAANGPALATANAQTRADGTFLIDLSLPAESEGAYRVRVFVQGEDGYAVGASDLLITGAASKQQAVSVSSKSTE